jgi:KaiC/GvpD/RAD55 family RecA-like ATPase
MSEIFRCLEVPPVDNLLPDGLRAGEVYLHSAPTGEGKTTLAIQLATAVARRCEAMKVASKILYVPCENDLMIPSRFLSVGANVTRHVADRFLSRRADSQFSASDQEKINCFSLLMHEFLLWLNPEKESGNEMNWIKQRINAEQSISLIVVDSLNGLIDNSCSRFNSACARESDFIAFINELKSIAKQARCPIWITSQLDASENKKARGSLPDFDRTSQMPGLRRYVDGGFASGKLNEMNCAIFCSLPNRNGKTSQWVGHLRNDIAAWSAANSPWQICNGRLVYRKERIVAQTYMRDGWDPRSAGFACDQRQTRLLDRTDARDLSSTETEEIQFSYRHSSKDSHSSSDASKAKKNQYRQLVHLCPGSFYFGLAEPECADLKKKYLMKITILDGKGSYIWQLIGQKPPPGLWLFETHQVLNKPVSQIRRYKSVDYSTTGLSRPQIKNDTRVLRAIAQHGPKLNERLKRNAKISDIRTLKKSIERLTEQGLLAQASDGLTGFRLPCQHELDSGKWSNPYQPPRPTSTRRKSLTDEQLEKKICKIIRERFRLDHVGISQRELRQELPCSPRRIQSAIEELLIREKIYEAAGKKQKYFPKKG